MRNRSAMLAIGAMLQKPIFINLDHHNIVSVFLIFTTKTRSRQVSSSRQEFEQQSTAIHSILEDNTRSVSLNIGLNVSTDFFCYYRNRKASVDIMPMFEHYTKPFARNV
jgi:hypothetical protein